MATALYGEQLSPTNHSGKKYANFRCPTATSCRHVYCRHCFRFKCDSPIPVGGLHRSHAGGSGESTCDGLAHVGAAPRTTGATAPSTRSTGTMSIPCAWPGPGPWSPGLQETTPLVHDGVMFLPQACDFIEAVDATDGTPLWEYRRPPVDHIASLSCANRNATLYKESTHYRHP